MKTKDVTLILLFALVHFALSWGSILYVVGGMFEGFDDPQAGPAILTMCAAGLHMILTLPVIVLGNWVPRQYDTVIMVLNSLVTALVLWALLKLRANAFEHNERKCQ